jgi:hypothetical protein
MQLHSVCIFCVYPLVVMDTLVHFLMIDMLSSNMMHLWVVNENNVANDVL